MFSKFILISSLGLATILHYAQISKKNLILILTLLVFCQPKFILQEYFEPLVLILLFSLFDLGKNNSVVIKENKTIPEYLMDPKISKLLSSKSLIS